MLQPSKTQAKKASAKKKATQAQSSKTSDKKAISRRKKIAPSLVTLEQRQQMIEEAAYFLAKKQGFSEHARLDY